MNFLRAGLAVLVGAAILTLGLVYVFQRDETWESTASVTLVPDPQVPAERTVLLEAFDRSGTLGTYVELLSSSSVEAAASVTPDSSTSVRAIPDTRVIDVTVTGQPEDLRGDVAGLIEVATVRAKNLGDLWTMEVLQEPSAPSRAGPPTGLLVGGIAFLAILGAIATFAAVSLLPRRPADPSLPAPVADDSNGSGSYESGEITEVREPARRWP